MVPLIWLGLSEKFILYSHSYTSIVGIIETVFMFFNNKKFLSHLFSTFFRYNFIWSLLRVFVAFMNTVTAFWKNIFCYLMQRIWTLFTAIWDKFSIAYFKTLHKLLKSFYSYLEKNLIWKNLSWKKPKFFLSKIRQ